jgi:hypothetical protein
MRHIFESRPLWDSCRVLSLSANLLAKHYHPTEVEDAVQAMEFAQRLGIRVLSTKRVIRDKINAYCIMGRIEGTTLEHVWSNLFTIKLALQLRYIIKRLRSVTSTTAGSPGSGECRHSG